MILVLLFMAVAAMVVPPMLSYMSTGLKTGMIFEENTRELYAAESGVTDGLWYVSYSSLDNLPEVGSSYKEYDFSHVWSYAVNQTVNDQDIRVSVQNIWIPKNIIAPTESKARSIIQAGKLLVTSSANSTSTYKIEAVYYPNAGENLTVESLGIWLPPGFTYVSGSSNLETGGPGQPYYPHSVEITPWASGQAVIWHFLSLPFDQLGPNVDAEHFPITAAISFGYTAAKPGTLPTAIAWITTGGVEDIRYTWDADVKVYRIRATAGGESVQVYATRSEMRQLGSAVKGDYVAIGNVLETATGDVNYRNRLLKESSATISSGSGAHQIPASATVRDAWLYWSGYAYEGHQTQVWYDSCANLNNWETSLQTVWQDSCSAMTNWSTQTSSQTVWSDDCSSFTSTQTVWQDTCDTINNWTAGAAWGAYSGRLRGHYSSGGDTARTITLTNGIDLNPYSGKTVTVTWNQDEDGYLDSSDGLKYSLYNGSWGSWINAFHDDNPTNPFSVTLPANYVVSGFKIRFYLDGMSGSGDYAYIDNIAITVTGSTWTAGADWDISSGQFRGHHASSHTENDRYLTRASDIDLSAYAGQTTTISWTQTEGGSLESTDALRFYVSGNGGSSWTGPIEAFHDDNPSSPFTYTIPSNLLTNQFRIKFYLDGFADSDYQGTEYAYIDDINISVATAADWDVYNGQFRGHHASGDRYLTRTANIDLSGYAGKTVTISWDQTSGGTLESSDILRFSFSSNGGSTWSASGSSQWVAFQGPNTPATPFTYTISSTYLTSQFRVRFYLDGFNESGEYAYIDNIRINVVGNGDWSVYNNQFRGHHDASHTEDDRLLAMVSSVDLSSYWGDMVTISWKQSEAGSLGTADGLKFYISNNGGDSWAGPMEAFHNDNPHSPFTYTIPNNYLTNGFKIKFYLDHMSGDGQYAYIDDITINDNSMGVDRVVFNGQEIVADKQQFKEDTWQGDPTGTWSYSCSYEATDLVKQMIQNHQLQSNGAGTYTVGHVLRTRTGFPTYTLYPSGTTGYPLAIPSSTSGMDDTSKQYSYAAWSLIIIYTSPETQGHQLYFYDDFNFVENDTLDFPVSGFLAPEDPTGSSATFFVGEGDNGYTPDGVNFNGHALSDAINPANNVWNSYSNALPSPYINGIDLDTFDVSSYIQPRDTYADIELYSDFEIYNVIYVILSFRNDSEFGGVITFLIGN